MIIDKDMIDVVSGFGLVYLRMFVRMCVQERKRLRGSVYSCG